MVAEGNVAAALFRRLKQEQGDQPLSQSTHISALDEYSADRSPDRVWGLSPLAWVQIGVVAVLMVAVFRFNLARLWGKTNPINGQDPNWQHAIFVPLIGLYYLYIHRDELLRGAGAPVKKERAIRIIAVLGLVVLAALGLFLLQGGEIGFPLLLTGVLMAGLAVPAILPTSSALGAVLLLEGLMVFAYGIFPGQNDYVKDLGMVITLFGAATLLAGWPVMRVAWFPIAFLVVALPWPELVYAKLAWPLQQLAASVAVGTLRVFGVEAQNFGTRIMMVDMNGRERLLNVAEACAGLKSVMTFLMVAGTVAFLGSRALWEKALITVSAIPIAIFCNVLRVSGQGLLDRYWSHEWSEGFAHQFAGLVMLIPGFFMIMGIGWALDKLFIEEIEKDKLTGGGGGEDKGARRGKRVIVEVPKKQLPASPTVGQGDVAMAAVAVSASEPATSAFAAVSVAPVEDALATPPVPPTTLKASAPRKPLPAAPSTAGATTLKASVAPKRPQPVAPATGSTLKPSTAPKSPAPAATPSPASTLKPSAPRNPLSSSSAPAAGSTLKPSSKPATSRPAAAAASVPGSTLKPSSSPKPRPQAAPTVSGLKPSPATPRPATPAPAAGPTQPKEPRS